MIVLVRKVVAWLGFDGRSTKSEWLHSAVEMLPPLIAGGLVASVDGLEASAAGCWAFSTPPLRGSCGGRL
jgi:hypothetical protein